MAEAGTTAGAASGHAGANSGAMGSWSFRRSRTRHAACYAAGARPLLTSELQDKARASPRTISQIKRMARLPQPLIASLRFL